MDSPCLLFLHKVRMLNPYFYFWICNAFQKYSSEQMIF